jgi:hypothetical protein
MGAARTTTRIVAAAPGVTASIALMTGHRRKRRVTTETKEILIFKNDGKQILVKNVPVDAKVTFSHVNPAGAGGWNGYCVRIYKTESQQLAVFTGVESFRDLSLKVFERKIETELEASAWDGPNGRREKTDRKTTAEWEEMEV